VKSSLDIAKNVFQVHGIDAAEKVVVRKQLRRGQVMKFFEALPPCLVGMEACATEPTLADLQEQVSALTRELAEAREQQTPNAECEREGRQGNPLHGFILRGELAL
jgi:transposase